MRILQIINVKWYNATAWYAVYLAYKLKKQGHSCAIVTTPGSCAILQAKKLGLDVYEIPLNSHKIRDIIESNRRINDLCKNFKPDIVNCHRGESFFVWALKKRRFAYTLIRTRGDQRLPSTDFINRYLHNTCADAIIATNTKMAKYFMSTMKTPPSKLYTILGGVDTSVFYPDREKRCRIRSELKFTQNDIVIGIVGRFDPVKGFKESLKAFSQLFHMPDYLASLQEENAKNLHLVIIGKNSIYNIDVLKKMANDFAIPEKYVHFILNPPDICAYMNMFDVGLIASIGSETIARVAFEMIACDIPLIASNVGVMPDIVPEENIYSPHDLDALTALFLRAREEIFRKNTLKLLRNRLVGENEFEKLESIEKFENSNNYENYAQKYTQERLTERVCNQAERVSSKKEVFSKDEIYGWTLDKFAHKTLEVYENSLK